MRQVHLAELKDSWSAWLGVCLTFIAVNFALALPALIELIGVRAVTSGKLNFWSSAAYTMSPAINILFCCVVGAVVVGSATSLVIDSRRGSLARLSLAGATPKQVVSTVMSQIAVVSISCAIIADILAFALLKPTLTFLNDDKTLNLVVPPATFALWPPLAANLLAVGVALVGARRQAKRASEIPPVEALRQASATKQDRMTIGRWAGVVAIVALIVAVFALIPTVVSLSDKEKFSNIMISGMTVLMAMGALLAVLAPLLVGPVTRVWTRLVPRFDPSWELTRQTVVVKAARLTKSVVPVMLAVGLLFGMIMLTDVMLATLSSFGYNKQLSGTGPQALLQFLGLPLLVALSGGVGSLIMMSKQRDAEIALSGIVGTTPGQRVAMPVMEGLIIAISGALLSLVMVGVVLGYLSMALPAAGFPFIFAPSYLVFAASLGVCLLVTVGATLLPTLSSLRKPEPRVIARLIAE